MDARARLQRARSSSAGGTCAWPVVVRACRRAGGRGGVAAWTAISSASATPTSGPRRGRRRGRRAAAADAAGRGCRGGGAAGVGGLPHLGARKDDGGVSSRACARRVRCGGGGRSRRPTRQQRPVPRRRAPTKAAATRGPASTRGAKGRPRRCGRRSSGSGGGTRTKLHVDVWRTDAWPAQLQGRAVHPLSTPAHARAVDPATGSSRDVGRRGDRGRRRRHRPARGHLPPPQVAPRRRGPARTDARHMHTLFLTLYMPRAARFPSAPSSFRPGRRRHRAPPLGSLTVNFPSEAQGEARAAQEASAALCGGCVGDAKASVGVHGVRDRTPRD